METVKAKNSFSGESRIWQGKKQTGKQTKKKTEAKMFSLDFICLCQKQKESDT